jgi:hypothetical protein
MTNKCITSLHDWYLSDKNGLSAQKSEITLFRTIENVFQPFKFSGRL